MHELPQRIVVLHEENLIGQHAGEIDEAIELISTGAAANTAARIVDLQRDGRFSRRESTSSGEEVVHRALLGHEFFEFLLKLYFVQVRRRRTSGALVLHQQQKIVPVQRIRLSYARIEEE